MAMFIIRIPGPVPRAVRTVFQHKFVLEKYSHSKAAITVIVGFYPTTITRSLHSVRSLVATMIRWSAKERLKVL